MIRRWYPHVVSTIALIVALTMSGAYAAQHWVGPKQIKKGAVRAKHIHRGAVRSAAIGRGQIKARNIGANQVTARAIGRGQVGTDEIAPGAVGPAQLAQGAIGASQLASRAVGSAALAAGAVKTENIAEGQVTPTELSLPEPLQMEVAAGAFAAAYVSQEYSLVAEVGKYNKQDPETNVQVAWTGTAKAGFSPCVFQLRVDGAPSAANAGEVYVQNSSTPPVAATALFRGLALGEHTIEVWARSTNDGSGTPEGGYPCEIGPAETTIGQTFVVTEQVT